MKAYLKLLLLLLLPLAAVVAYALLASHPVKLWDGYVLQQADLSHLRQAWRAWSPGPGDGRPDGGAAADSAVACPTCATSPDAAAPLTYADSLTRAMTARLEAAAEGQRQADGAPHDSATADGGPSAVPATSAAPPAQPTASEPLRIAPPDTTRFRILFFGDSMLEGLARRCCDYAMENGYALTSVIWYSSSTQLWATTDTLQYFLSHVRPDYVMICLGSNELFVRDLAQRDAYIATMVDRLHGLPFIWISPPNWKDDTGINDLIIKHVGRGRYFDSRHLELERGKDHVHPTFTAAEGWMDSVATWMSSDQADTPLPMRRPSETRPRKFRQYMLRPVR